MTPHLSSSPDPHATFLTFEPYQAFASQPSPPPRETAKTLTREPRCINNILLFRSCFFFGAALGVKLPTNRNWQKGAGGRAVANNGHFLRVHGGHDGLGLHGRVVAVVLPAAAAELPPQVDLGHHH